MNKKKAIALLLSAAMVFTMNAAVFAEGTTSVDEEVGVQYVYKDPGSYESTQSNSAKAATYSSNTKNEEAVKEALKAGVTVKEVPVAVNYTGKKIKSKDIVDNGYTAEEKDIETESTKSYWGLYVSANGYAAPVKAVKITTKGRDVGDTITWKIKSVCNAKYVVSMNAAGDVSTLTKKEAKAGLKELKSALNNIKNIEFSTSVETGYYTHVISSTSANAVKKGGWTTELDKVFAYTDSLDNSSDIDETLVVTKKNGNIKKVQTVSYVKDKTTHLNYGLIKTDEGGRGYYVKKLKFTTLKKGKDYTISGNTVVLDQKNYAAVLDNGSYAPFQANW